MRQSKLGEKVLGERQGYADVESPEHIQNRLQRANAMYIEYVKALLVLNGGAAVAVLGLVQVLVGKDLAVAAQFARWGLPAAGVYLFGALLSAYSFWVSFAGHSIAHTSENKDSLVLALRGILLFPILATLAFVLGSITALLGVSAAI